MKRLIKKFAKKASTDFPLHDKYFEWVRIDKATLDEGHLGWEAGAFDVTAEREGIIKLTSTVLAMDGGNNEVREYWTRDDGVEMFGNYKADKWNNLLEDIKQNGIQEQIFIVVEKDGTPKVYEGNHRIQAAKQLQLPEIPVEVRYFGNSQKDTTYFKESIFNNENNQ